MIRKVLFTALSFQALLFAMGEGKAPPPGISGVEAMVMDRKGVSHRLKGLICGDGGEIRFRKGAVDYRLSQMAIEMMRVVKRSGSEAEVEVVLRGGKKKTYTVSSSLRCSANIEGGRADFYIRDVETITFERGERR